jgi:uncharacterized membrane-anchored protein
MRKAIAIIAGILVLAFVDYGIAARERVVTQGRVLLLELTPVDPRSLMQGDYMALRFVVARGVSRSAAADGRIVLAVDNDGVARFRRLDDGAPLAPGEARLRYRIRNGDVKLATNAFFFEEGRGGDYQGARYGEFRVADDGDAVLTGLRDVNRALLGR